MTFSCSSFGYRTAGKTTANSTFVVVEISTSAIVDTAFA